MNRKNIGILTAIVVKFSGIGLLAHHIGPFATLGFILFFVGNDMIEIIRSNNETQ